MKRIANTAYVSFTGIDNKVEAQELKDFVVNNDGVEIIWGILVSAERFGQARYPTLEKIASFLNKNLNTRLHICGDLSRLLNSTEALPFWFEGLIHANMKSNYFIDESSVQINAATYNIANLRKRKDHFDNLRFVLQWREKYFDQACNDFTWLYDCSGGRGEVSKEVPIFPNSFYDEYGYAGGLNPDNIASIVSTVCKANPTYNFWIDMESGIRDENNEFSLTKCQAILDTTI